ncbi:MAG TPA: aminotransferase class I/II-fold pyridoxal phosphate-dependent enzyme [Pirellulales bacterium]|nr:aminotransferase class I/II-fold pyridoxal phosphate-dependent enzyme [Pirellulales bacterium]
MKSRLEELAIFGRPPAFVEPLHVGGPNLGDRERLLERLQGMLDRRRLSNDGPLVREFESRVAELLGVDYFLATCNGTAALELLVRATGLSGEVIVPSYTFIATAHALDWLGVKPVFCDIDPATHHLDPSEVERLITPRTSAVLGVHLWGRPCDAGALEAVTRRHGLKLLFDAAHAFGCSRGGRMIGNFGLAEVFSFHATKIVNAFEGGAIATNDRQLAERLRLMRNFGFAGYDRVVERGINGKMNEASAAMALTSLESMDEFVAANRRNYEEYRLQLGTLPAFRLLSYDEGEKCNYQYVVVEVGDGLALTRDELVSLLWSENILARRYFYPGCHRAVPYRDHEVGRRLPSTEKVADRVLLLPTGTSVDPHDIAGVVAILKLAVDNPQRVAQQLQQTGPCAGAMPTVE